LPTDAESAVDRARRFHVGKDYTISGAAQSSRTRVTMRSRARKQPETRKKCGATRGKRQKPAFFLASFIAE
jgi:hypothetical protein